jgi:hypothetical protein|tara:strand:+ start:1595 stop:2086 length:492 start_codon:yes stop_codon:yes gene_type:complete
MANLIDPTEMMFTAFEPKVKNRYVFYVDGIPSYLIRKAARPKIVNGDVTIKHINNERHVKGRSSWETISLELYDPIVPSGAQAVMEWVRLHHESVTGRNGYADFYKKDCTINILGPVGDKVEEWTLKGAFITDADFGEITWEDDGTPMVVALTLRFDYAILQY